MSIADKLQTLQTIKTDIKTSILNKGVEVGDDFSTYANAIDSIEGGGEITDDTIIKTARVLYITENGTYQTKYSEPIYPEEITGYFDDGTPFHSYCELVNSAYSTGIPAKKESRIEFWYKQKGSSRGEQWQALFGAGNSDGGADTFDLKYYSNTRNKLEYRVGNQHTNFEFDNSVWCHFLIENNTVYINGENVATVNSYSFRTDNTPFLINSVQGRIDGNANGLFGMFKVDDTIFIPTENGWKNYNTGEMLEAVYEDKYVFYENSPIYGTGNLIKTVNVNVIPQVDLNTSRMSLGYSLFTTVPYFIKWYDGVSLNNMFRMCTNLKEINIDEEISDMSYAFNGCSKLTQINLNTSKTTVFSNAFEGCTSLTSEELEKLDLSSATNISAMLKGTKITYFPSLDTSNVTNMANLFENTQSTLKEIYPINTSNVTNMTYFCYNFSGGHILEKLPEFECGKVTNMGSYFCYSSYKLNKLTDVGGWKNLKVKWNDGYGLSNCPNLTYQSCINILNGLYDFVGNGQTPTSSQGILKVHQNFLDLVGDEITIGTNKGWTITA